MHRKLDKSTIKQLILLFIIFFFYTIFQIVSVGNIYNKSVQTAFSENIFYEFSNYLSSKYQGGKILAKDEFLINWLQKEDDRTALNSFLKEKSELLGCSAIDIVASRSLIAYQHAGTIETLEEDDDADRWYYDLIESGVESSNEVYYDLNHGVLYIYLNELIYSDSGELLGVLGILIEYNQLSSLLGRYMDSGITAYLINDNGEIYIHPDQSMIGNVNIYDFFGFLQKADKDNITHKINYDNKNIYTIDGLEGLLVVESDNSFMFNKILSIIISAISLYLIVSFLIIRERISKS